LTWPTFNTIMILYNWLTSDKLQNKHSKVTLNLKLPIPGPLSHLQLLIDNGAGYPMPY